jgi:alginate O-acetyltransferase complex protein AlgI
MIFTSFEFLCFFLAILIVRSCLRNFAAEKWFLLAASIAFYLSWSVPCIFLILFTALADYSIGRRLSRTADPTSRRRLLVLSLVANLGLLGFFKYANFFLENLTAALNALGWHVSLFHYNIVLPPAISFFTFASLGYVIDVYYERIRACESPRDYTLFVTFFPKVMSGPIARGEELLPQFKERVRATLDDFELGLTYFMIGAVKKLAIADQVAPHVNLIFSTPNQYDSLTLLMGAVGYTIQLYCDFSGYTDMAIGCGRMMGFRLPENFQMPYSSSSITEFWRRWHITLSNWFRDCLFLPLEMATRKNPYPTLRVCANMTITMLLCGLWHGASWTFVIWGGIHGTALAAHKVWTKWNPFAALESRVAYRFVWTGFSHLLTLGVIVVAFVFFRAQSLSDAVSYLHRMFAWSHSGTRLISPYIVTAFIAVLLVHLLVNKDRNLAQELPRMSLIPRIVGYAGLILLLVAFGATDSAAFIYFQF